MLREHMHVTWKPTNLHCANTATIYFYIPRFIFMPSKPALKKMIKVIKHWIWRRKALWQNSNFFLTGNGNRYVAGSVDFVKSYLSKETKFVRSSKKQFHSPFKIECSLRRYPLDSSFAITFEINKKKTDKKTFVNSIAKFLYYVTVQTRFNGT